MNPTSKGFVKPWPKKVLLISMLALLISMTGCARRLVVVKGDETVPVKKSDLDNLHTDNENLLKALEECRSGR